MITAINVIALAVYCHLNMLPKQDDNKMEYDTILPNMYFFQSEEFYFSVQEVYWKSG